ncbi:MAG: translesion error-prone DNA polymerase V autoproteolytic subunit [Saprospiraceae bacterium]
MSFRKLHAGATLWLYAAYQDTALELPFLPFDISAGFPSPALDFIDLGIDLNEHLIDHPSATFYGRVQGDSMSGAGIHDGDLLVIDKSLQASDGRIAVCFLDGEFTLKRIRVDRAGSVWLMPENDRYPPIRIEEHQHFQVWGIVTYVIKKPL